MGIIFCIVILLVIAINLLVFTIILAAEQEKERVSYSHILLQIVTMLTSSICATWLLISVAPKSDSAATQVINDFRNNKIYKTEIINSDTTYYYHLKQKE